MLKQARLALVRAGIAAALAFCAPWAGAVDGVLADRIVVGQTISLRGGSNAYGAAVLAGVQTALDAANAAGGVHGRRVELRTLDDEERVEQAAANARQLIERDKVFLLFGPIEGGPSTAVMKVALGTGVPLFGPMAGAPTFRVPHQPMVFPVRAGHRREFHALLDYARRTGMTRAAFFRADTQAGREHLENFKRTCAELGMALVADLPFRPDVSDAELDRLAGRIGASGAQVVINHGSIGAYERLIRRTHERQVRVAFSGVNSGSAQLAQSLGELAHGMVFAQVVPSPWERKSAITREYQEAFARRHPGQPFSYGSLEGYVTAKALVAALKRAGPQPTHESLARGLYAAGGLDLADGLHARYAPGDHSGLALVDLSIVTREGRFRQ